jgi:ribosome-associated protein
VDSLEIAGICARIAAEKRAQDLLLLEMRRISAVADYFLVATARNRRQMSAIADQIRVDLKHLDVRHLHVEGRGSERWVLLDYGGVVVHLFDAETRAFYDLESLWADAPRVPLEKVLPEHLREDRAAADLSPPNSEA